MPASIRTDARPHRAARGWFLYLTRSPQAPATDKLTVDVTATPPPTGKTYQIDPGCDRRTPDIKTGLVACWQAYNAATHKDAMAVSIGVKVSYIASEYEDETGAFTIKIDPAAALPPGPDQSADQCVRAIVEPAIKDAQDGPRRVRDQADHHDQVAIAPIGRRSSSSSVTDRPDVRAMTLDDAQAFAVAQGWAKFRGEQVWRWVHQHGVRTFDEMTNLSREVRAELAIRATIGCLEVAEVQTSSDGTRKLRLVTHDGHSIESVLIPDGDKTTQCISSQVGCAVDCQFCATAKMGLVRNLDAGEIVDQVYLARRLLAEVEPGRHLTNIVYMGMGEPLHNYDNLIKSLRILTNDKGAKLAQRRVTVSTSGLVPKLERLGGETVRPNLAVSLNAANDETRDEIMPINRKWNIAKLLSRCAGTRSSSGAGSRSSTCCSPASTIRSPTPGSSRSCCAASSASSTSSRTTRTPSRRTRVPTRAVIDAFQDECKRLGLPTYLRTPRGDDIDAACGQLANRSAGATMAPCRCASRCGSSASVPLPAVE